MQVRIKDVYEIYEKEIMKGVKNKRKILEFEKNKIEYIVNIKRILESNQYDGGKYNIFLVYKPKVRVIMSQNVYDKVINHYVTRNILIPKLSKYLSNENVATRKNMGTTEGLRLLKKGIEYYKRYDKCYVLKIDIKKYFYNIDHEILKGLIKDDLTSEEYELICNIIDSTNKEYINDKIKKLENRNNTELPKYEYGKGLPIGNMTSQFLAIFYLSKLHHYIKHNLYIKHFIVYMDDYIILHESKEHMKYCLEEITKILTDYQMETNPKKTFITSMNNGINCLGYTFKVKNKKTIIKLSKETRKRIRNGIREKLYLYRKDLINLSTLFSSIETYKYGYQLINRKKIRKIIEKEI